MKSSQNLTQDLAHTSIHTPIGYIKIEGDELGISSLYFFNEDPGASEVVPEILAICALQLQQYFEGKRKTFDVKLRPQGTEFQMNVWNALLGIPYGVTRSYKDVALALRKEKAVRAVGAANGQNPISVIIPCHRVIGAKGDLTGYGGELWRKKWLLEHEQGIAYGQQTSLF